MALIEFHYPTEVGATTSWTPSVNHDPGASEPKDYPSQLTGTTGDDTLYVQDLGATRKTFSLPFSDIPKTDRDNLETFFDAVKKSANTFEYKDRDGNLHTVRWMNNFNFIDNRASIERFTGVIQLRGE